MKATVERFCPYHGGFVFLADCPILVTNEMTNGAARAAAGRPAAGRPRDEGAVPSAEDLGGSDPLGDAGEVPPRTEEAYGPPGGGSERRVRATLRPPIGRLIESRVDGLERLVLAHGPGVPRPAKGLGRLTNSEVPDLPDIVDLVGHSNLGKRPARACPQCNHPLPVTIDTRNAYPVALAGHTEASKTTTVVALVEAVAEFGAERLGVESFTATESTMAYLKRLDQNIFANYRRRRKTARTQRASARQHFPPLEFLTSLPGEAGNEASVLLQDAPGEELMNADIRALLFPSVRWSDAILFIYNPEDSPLLRREKEPTEERFGQDVLLNGIRDDLESRGKRDASGYDFNDPPLIVAVSKADLLPNPPDVRDGPAPEEDVQAALKDLRDAAMISAAKRWPKVHWRFIAPLPANGGEPQGVTDLFALLLTLLAE